MTLCTCFQLLALSFACGVAQAQERIPSADLGLVVRPNAAETAPRSIKEVPESGFRLESRELNGANSHLLADVPVSIGPGYRVTYENGGMTFTLALGRKAPELRSVRYEFESATIGDVLISTTSPTAAGLRDGRVVFDRGGLEEVYDATVEGLEQSFVFDHLPSRSGDLVVRGRLTTELQELASPDPTRALLFNEPGHGLLTIDRVLGFDAAGACVDGSLSLEGDLFELRLPRSFVEHATLPLVLDPFFVFAQEVGASLDDQDQPDVAYASGFGGEYAFVFRRSLASTVSDIVCELYTTTGSGPTITPIAVEVDNAADSDPSIATLEGLPVGFCVAWQRNNLFAGTDVHIAYVSQTDGAVTPPIVLAGGSAPDVGGTYQIASGGKRAVVVYEDGDRIRSQAVSVAAGTLLTGSNTVLPNEANTIPLSRPTITQEVVNPDDSASPGVFIVGYEQDFSTDRDLQMIAVDRFGSPVSAALSLTTIGPDEEYPDIAAGTDDDAFLVFQREQTMDDGDNDIVGIKLDAVSLGSSWSVTFGSSEIEIATFGADQRRPAVGSATSEWIIAWMDNGFAPTVYDALALTLDKVGCQVCEFPVLIRDAITFQGEIEVAAFEGVDTAIGEDGAAIVWDRFNSDPFTTQATVQTSLWEGDGGLSVVGAGVAGCAGGGTIGWSGSPHLGSESFTLSVSDVAPTAFLALLNLAAPGPSLPCGPCEILPIGTLYSAPLVGNAASKEFAVPCDGAILEATARIQWIVGPVPTPGCSFASVFAVSDSLNVFLSY